jgi:hypothetical protein
MSFDFSIVKAINKLNKLFDEHNRNKSEVERVLIEMINKVGHENEWFTYDNFVSHETFLFDNAENKRQKVKKIFDSIYPDVRTFTSSVLDDGKTVRISISGAGIPHNMQNFSMTKRRYDYLISKNEDINVLINCYLTYKSIVALGHQLGVPLRMIEILSETITFTLEGFASPFNARLPLIEPNIPFCSVFGSLDKVYGSVGSFFDQELNDQVLTCNPPYSIPLMNKVTEYIIEQFDKAETMAVFYMVPYSWDAAYHLDMEKCEYLKSLTITPRMEHYYEDTLTNERRPSRIRTSFFFLVKGLDLPDISRIITNFYGVSNLLDYPELLGDDNKGDRGKRYIHYK